MFQMTKIAEFVMSRSIIRTTTIFTQMRLPKIGFVPKYRLTWIIKSDKQPGTTPWVHLLALAGLGERVMGCWHANPEWEVSTEWASHHSEITAGGVKIRP